jgi:hypothetical protein
VLLGVCPPASLLQLTNRKCAPQIVRGSALAILNGVGSISAVKNLTDKRQKYFRHLKRQKSYTLHENEGVNREFFYYFGHIYFACTLPHAPMFTTS